MTDKVFVMSLPGELATKQSFTDFHHELIDERLPKAKDYDDNPLFSLGRDGFSMGRRKGSVKHDDYIYRPKKFFLQWITYECINCELFLKPIKVINPVDIFCLEYQPFLLYFLSSEFFCRHQPVSRQYPTSRALSSLVPVREQK